MSKPVKEVYKMRAWWGGALALTLGLGLAEVARSGALIPFFKRKRVEEGTPAAPSGEPSRDTHIMDRWFSWPGGWPPQIDDDFSSELLGVDER